MWNSDFYFFFSNVIVWLFPFPNPFFHAERENFKTSVIVKKSSFWTKRVDPPYSSANFFYLPKEKKDLRNWKKLRKKKKRELRERSELQHRSSAFLINTDCNYELYFYKDFTSISCLSLLIHTCSNITLLHVHLFANMFILRYYLRTL